MIRAITQIIVLLKYIMLVAVEQIANIVTIITTMWLSNNDDNTKNVVATLGLFPSLSTSVFNNRNCSYDEVVCCCSPSR